MNKQTYLKELREASHGLNEINQDRSLVSCEDFLIDHGETLLKAAKVMEKLLEKDIAGEVKVVETKLDDTLIEYVLSDPYRVFIMKQPKDLPDLLGELIGGEE